MTFYKQLSWSAVDRNLFRRIRLCNGNWSTAHPAVLEFRNRLLTLQNYRCAYCQAGIEADENGHREIEHILPKSPSKNCTKAKGTSNATDSRRSTLGYAEFCFEPRNLVLTCKQCNTNKGSYDPLKERRRPRPLAKFPRPIHIEWFNPHFHKYSLHIHLNSDFIFSARSKNGAAVIRECGLDKADVLERKFQFRARSRANHCAGIKSAIENLASGVVALEFSMTNAINAICEKFALSMGESEELLDLCINAKTTTDYEKLRIALASVDRKFQRKGKSARSAAKSLQRR